MSKRLFIAVPISVSANIIELSQNLKVKLNKERINWVSLHNFHLTLKFLGDVDEGLIPEITDAVRQVSGYFKPFEIKIKGLGKFSSSGHVKVLWLGIEDAGAILNSLSVQLNKQLTGLGFKAESRSFRAHLTLARVKYIRNQNVINDLLRTYAHTHFQNYQVKNIILYQSILKPTGPVYKSLTAFDL